MNDLYIGVNGKLHDLIRRCEDLSDELERQIRENPQKCGTHGTPNAACNAHACTAYICPEWRIKR